MTQQHLQQAYSRQSWQLWLQKIFGSQIYFETQAENVDIAKEDIKSVQRFASVKLADGKTLAVLDIETRAGIQIARNRVGLRELVVKLIDHANYHGILAFYHSEDKSQSSYRFSFISSEPTIDAEGNFTVQSTAPKRFSYVLGENEKTKTPADRLKIIAGKHGKATLEDVKNAFSVETLTKEFYAELSNWYFWALQNVDFPDDQDKLKLKKVEEGKRDEEEKKLTELRNSTSVIRLITRLMFVWFLKQKKLINDELFDIQELDNILNYKDKTGSTFYKAILQNLFFATLNTEMGDNRKFVRRQSGIQEFYRYERFFKNKERFIELTKNTPFLNGGLFENLDKNVGEENEIRIDCFSNRLDKEQLLKVPDFLFFSEEKQIDLNKIYDTKSKNYKVRGLIDILKSYNFTIEENTSTDIEVALDPELLGKVFENLLASFNPETQTTARKQTGSFYTPREIVDYMVNESVSTYLQEKVGDDWENDVRTIPVLHEMKILDPACGSGAFPMGILHKMVQILQKLDPKNARWKQRQLDIAGKIEDVRAREAAIANIEEAFENNELDYGRKLFLIENCIFGIDIQPIAVQIAKLRFFISLICEQTPNLDKPNLGIRPLPNLETKFVAANALIRLDKPQQRMLGMDVIEPLEKELAEVRHKHFSARTPETKRKYRDRDSDLRTQIAKKLKEIGFGNDTAENIASWNPYDQNTHAEWFDYEWMFDIKDGFDILIGNPPYIRKTQISEELKKYLNKNYFSAFKQYDIYLFFNELALIILKKDGVCSFIQPNKFLSAEYGYKLCNLIKANAVIKSIWNVSLDNIFEASVYPYVYVFKKTGYKKDIVLESVNLLDYSEKLTGFDNFTNTSLLIKKIKAKSVFIKSITDKIKRGIPNSKILFNEDGKYYGIKSTQLENAYNQPVANIRFDYLSKSDEKLKTKEFSKKLFLLPRTVLKVRAIYKDNSDHILDRIYYFENKDPNFEDKFILGFLNSKLLTFYYEQIYGSTKIGGGYIDLKGIQIENFPIPIVTAKQQQPIVSLVDYILRLYKVGENNRINEYVPNSHIIQLFEEVIDALVYELYFNEDFENAGISFMQYAERDFKDITGNSDNEAIEIIQSVYQKLRDNNNGIRNNLKIMDIKLANLIMPIKSIR